MKRYIKTAGKAILMLAILAGSSSCDDALDLEPITENTPDDYYKTADQLAAYVLRYYDTVLYTPFSNTGMTHTTSYNSGVAQSDVNTDISCIKDGSNKFFAKNYWEMPASKQLQSYYGEVRTWNYFLSHALPNYEAGIIAGDETLTRNYIGEAYFLRALILFRVLAYWGDCPVFEEVVTDNDADIIEHSKRVPRNEAARFILRDLDRAIEMCADRSVFKGQRINKQTAALLKSRVALFEATFEKYHRGSGRVPGDANWPGAKMEYNKGKTFDIDGEIKFFLEQCMDAAKIAVGNTPLTPNNKVIQPSAGQITGWNPYFEMYSQPSLANVEEVLLWKEYSEKYNIYHRAPYYVGYGCNDGMTRAFVEGFLMTDGKPFYASSLYKGDKSIDNAKADRDYRLQLFVWGESTLYLSDNKFTEYGKKWGQPQIARVNTGGCPITGYQNRKFYTYDGVQTNATGSSVAWNACPIFRTAEAMLNYIEACVELNNSVDGTATNYWQSLRERAGVNTDFNISIQNTDMSKELQLSVYSGREMVSPLLFNVRRERVCETFNETLRFFDLVRWRSFDRLMDEKYIVEGINFWDEKYKQTDYCDITSDGSANATVSSRELSKYIRPYQRNMMSTNMLKDGYTWTEAYYLRPLGLIDITSASPDRSVENSVMYQNINWPNYPGYALK